MKIDKEKTVAFTGHRTLMTADGSPDANLENVIRTELSFCLEECYKEGKNTFISGLAVGWDMLCAEEVLKLKAKHPNVILIAAIPFPGQELMYSNIDKHRYKRIYEAADHREFITEGGYDRDAYHKRNDWMVANCGEMIAYDSGKKTRSGTSSTVRKAKFSGVEVLNIYEELHVYFTITHSAKRFLQGFPHVNSFRYGRAGVIFEGDDHHFPVNFEQISDVRQEGLFLKFELNNGVKYVASLNSDSCLIDVSNVSAV